jgi:hypothetical protein
MPTHREKTTYRTYGAALRALLKSSKRRGTPLRIYTCHECKGFHLTSERRG